MTAHGGYLKDFLKFVIKHTKISAGYGSLGEVFARHPHRVGVVSQVYLPSIGDRQILGLAESVTSGISERPCLKHRDPVCLKH